MYGGFYSQETVRRLVAYAAQRGITIVPEIDMPAHATAAIAAYPEIGVTSTPPTQVPADWGIYSNLYNVDEPTFKFIYAVLDEVLALFPGKFVHVGGDEAVKDQWKASPRVQARMRELGIADEAQLQSYFVRRLEEYLSRRGRRLIGWDEILEGGIAPGATVMSWHGVDGARKAALAGHDAVLAAHPTLYFDNRQSDSPTGPPGRGFVVSLEDVYKFEPISSDLTPDQKRHILGLQGNIWTEHIRTEERVALMAFPRAAAVAEVGWSRTDRRDWHSFLTRLIPQAARAQAIGIRYSTEEFDVRPAATSTRSSRELKLCTDKLTLALEDDAPLEGPRAVFLVDIMNPCWIYPDVDLTNGAAVSAYVGQLPFNFQIGADAAKIPLRTPQTSAGELEVRLGCDGERVATLPLATAAQRNDVTELPTARIPPHAGKHDLCFSFTQKSLDPFWALDKVRVEPVKR
jgi:hexosaminidase